MFNLEFRRHQPSGVVFSVPFGIDLEQQSFFAKVVLKGTEASTELANGTMQVFGYLHPKKKIRVLNQFFAISSRADSFDPLYIMPAVYKVFS